MTAKKRNTTTHDSATPALVTLDTTSSTTVLGPNMRLTTRDEVDKDEDLIASVRAHGVLSPVLAYRDGADVVIYAGQRRFHAAAITGQPLPAVVWPTAPADMDRLTGQWDENERRQDMTDTDRVNGIEQMALLGVTAEQIAQATRLGTDRVEAALRVAKSSKRQTVAEQNLSLDQAHGLVEFEADEDATQELLDALTDEGREDFDHVLAALRYERDATAAIAAATEALTERGITVLDQRPAYDSKAKQVRGLAAAESGEGIDPEAHESCPGHAVYVDTFRDWQGSGQIEVREVALCLEPKQNAHRDRYATTNGSASGPMSEEEKAERRRVVANNKAWDAATAVRREWLAKLVTRKTPPTGSEALVAAAITGTGCWVSNATSHEACTATGMDPKATAKEITAKRTTAKRQTVLALAHVLGQWEAKADRHTWRNPSPWDTRVLATLIGWGYKPASIEQDVAGHKH